jgi:hypothetical protein
MRPGGRMHDVGVIYLYRFAEGDGPVRRFLATYARHPAGLDHDLNVVFKGFPDRHAFDRGRASFGDIAFNVIEHEDVGYDIGSYRWAATVASNRRLLFLNTFSQILADGWLRQFDRALDESGIGLVGATGSWLAATAGYEAEAKYYLGEALRWPLRFMGRPVPEPVGSKRTRTRRHRPLHRYFLSPLEYAQRLYQYGRFPNPHIRTNAFMIERERFLSLDFPRFASKVDAYKFESGRRSMTRQILARNLSPVVVDKNGQTYAVSDWRSSKTFWTERQTNLIIADNRTADYASGDQEQRRVLENLAWVSPWDWYASEA